MVSNLSQAVKYNDLTVDTNISYYQAFEHIFGWLVKCMDNWNVHTEASRHPKVEAVIISIPNGIRIQIFSGEKLILTDTNPIHEQDNYLAAMAKWSSFVMLKVLHAGIANMILLTPIHKN